MHGFDDLPKYPEDPILRMRGPAKNARRRDDDDEDEADDDDDRPKKKRSGGGGGKAAAAGGMGVMLIVGGVIAFLGCCICLPVGVALVVPAVQKVREAAARTQSTNNLKNIGLGFHSFSDANKRLPFNGANDNRPGFSYSKQAAGGKFTSGSWAFQILPFIDQGPVFEAVNRNAGIQPYMCPGRGRPSVEVGGGAWTDYFYNNYLNNPTQAADPGSPDGKRTLIGITDGSSNTVFVGHGNIGTPQYSSSANVTLSTNIFNGGTPGTMRAGANAPAKGAPPGVILSRDTAAPPTTGSWGGPFSQGGLMALGDATVRLFPYATASFGAFLTPTGEELVTLPD